MKARSSWLTALPAVLAIIALLFIIITVKADTTGSQHSMHSRKSGSNIRKQPSKLRCNTTPSKCLYGILPGVLNLNQSVGDRWQVLSPCCKMKNYVAEYALGKSSDIKPLSILFLSDSIDLFTMRAYCGMTKRGLIFNSTHIDGVDGINPTHSRYNHCNSSSNPLNLAQVFFPTLTKRAPLTSPWEGKMHGYKFKMQMARTSWTEQHGASDPDVVVLGGGWWDIVRWLEGPLEELEDVEKTVRQNLRMSSELLQWWMGQVHDAIISAQTLFPNSKLLWRGYAMPRYDYTTGAISHRKLGGKALITQVNAAGITAAQDMGIELVLLSQMVEELTRPDHYLQDSIHPSSVILMEVLNVILNIALRGDTGAAS